MHKLIKSAALAATLALAIGAAGCTTVPVKLDPEALIPMALTTCADAPPVPARPGPGLARTDSQKATFLTQTSLAYDDCKGTVHAIAVRRAALDKQAGVKSKVPPADQIPLVTSKDTTPLPTAPAPAPAKQPFWHLSFHIPFLGAKPTVAPAS